MIDIRHTWYTQLSPQCINVLHTVYHWLHVQHSIMNSYSTLCDSTKIKQKVLLHDTHVFNHMKHDIVIFYYSGCSRLTSGQGEKKVTVVEQYIRLSLCYSFCKEQKIYSNTLRTPPHNTELCCKWYEKSNTYQLIIYEGVRFS